MQEGVIDPESLEHINMDVCSSTKQFSFALLCICWTSHNMVYCLEQVPRTATVDARFELAPDCSELDRGDRTPAELAQWLVTALPREQSLVVPLLRVLSAICVRSPQRGYTQGMNFVAAVLLLHVPEEAAFWCLAGVQDIVIPQLWDEPTRTGRVVELQLLDQAMANGATTARLLEGLSCIDTACFATGWVDTLFAGNWPSDVVARCLDGLLSSNQPAALQRIILSYLESVQDVIVPATPPTTPHLSMAAGRAIVSSAYDPAKFTNDTCVPLKQLHTCMLLWDDR